MASVNKVIIVGNLGADPEVKTFDNGGKIANISVATTDRWTDRNTGEQREATEWHRITFNDRLADIVAQYLRKGSSVYVEGSLRTRKWTDQQGIERYTTEIRATSMQMLGSRQGGNDGYQGGGYNNYNGGFQGGNFGQNNTQNFNNPNNFNQPNQGFGGQGGFNQGQNFNQNYNSQPSYNQGGQGNFNAPAQTNQNSFGGQAPQPSAPQPMQPTPNTNNFGNPTQTPITPSALPPSGDVSDDDIPF